MTLTDDEKEIIQRLKDNGLMGLFADLARRNDFERRLRRLLAEINASPADDADADEEGFLYPPV
jgi:hypothetical protein